MNEFEYVRDPATRKVSLNSGAAPDPDGERGARPPSLRFSEIAELKVDWAAEPIIPWGAETILVGFSGTGKTTFAGHVGARLTRGQPVFPGMEAAGKADVLIVSAEDSLRRVLVARLRIAGADLSRVHGWDLIEAELVLPEDIERLRAEIRRTGSRLVILDPISAFVSSRVDTHNTASLRSGLMGPLGRLAEQEHGAILGILHPRKSGGRDVREATSGAGAWVDAARSAIVFGAVPGADESDPRRIVALGKSNYAALGAAWEVALRIPAGENHPAISYIGPSQVRSADVLALPADDSERSGAAECTDWLADLLADGGDHLVCEIENAAKAAGFTKKNLRMARARLGVVRHKGTGSRSAGWFMSLPNRPSDKAPSASCEAGAGPLRAPCQDPQEQAVFDPQERPDTGQGALFQNQGPLSPKGPKAGGNGGDRYGPDSEQGKLSTEDNKVGATEPNRADGTPPEGDHQRAPLCMRCGLPTRGSGTVCDPCLDGAR